MFLHRDLGDLSALYLCANKIRALELASSLFQVDLAAGASLRYISLGMRLSRFVGWYLVIVLLANIVSIEESMSRYSPGSGGSL